MWRPVLSLMFGHFRRLRCVVAHQFRIEIAHNHLLNIRSILRHIILRRNSHLCVIHFGWINLAVFFNSLPFIGNQLSHRLVRKDQVLFSWCFHWLAIQQYLEFLLSFSQTDNRRNSDVFIKSFHGGRNSLKAGFFQGLHLNQNTTKLHLVTNGIIHFLVINQRPESTANFTIIITGETIWVNTRR